ncbi:MAG: hypothetical protein ABFR89_11975 [Actinomycetota bacterium]
MTELGWKWVVFAYVVGYGAFALYAGSIVWRIRRTRQAIERAE